MGNDCNGQVASLRGQYVLFSGSTYVHGEHETKENLRLRVKARGGSNAPDRNTAITLLVIGEQIPERVVDPVNVRSQKAVFVDEQRRRGNHICIVDSTGFTALVDGLPAACLETRLVETGNVEISPPPPPRIFAGPAGSAVAPTHQPTGLEVDLAALDRGTAAHIELAAAFAKHLSAEGVMALVPGPKMPRFDLGWQDPANAAIHFVAELKSLTGAHESQQIRLGVGQVLDYVSTIRMLRPDIDLVPVLVLQHEPQDGRWMRLAEMVGLRLTWAPSFPNL